MNPRALFTYFMHVLTFNTRTFKESWPCIIKGGLDWHLVQTPFHLRLVWFPKLLWLIVDSEDHFSDVQSAQKVHLKLFDVHLYVKEHIDFKQFYVYVRNFMIIMH